MLIWRHGWNLNGALSFERLDVIKLKYLFATSWFINLCNNGHLQGGGYWFKIFPFQPFRCLLAVKAFYIFIWRFSDSFYCEFFFLRLLHLLKICNYIFFDLFWEMLRCGELWISFCMEWGNLKLKGVFIFFFDF